jgi:hypothetical protein
MFMHFEFSFINKPDTGHGFAFFKKHFTFGYMKGLAVGIKSGQPFFGTLPAQKTTIEVTVGLIFLHDGPNFYNKIRKNIN